MIRRIVQALKRRAQPVSHIGALKQLVPKSGVDFAPTEVPDRGPLAILGYDDRTLGVLKVAVAAGFRPALLHAPKGSIAAGTAINVSLNEIRAMAPGRRLAADGETLSVPVADEEDFRRFVTENRIPILIGAYYFRERDFFRENLLFARNRLKFDGRILHPAMLCDFFRCDQRRFAIVGFPGSGNMVVQNIGSRLLPSPPVPYWAQEPLHALIAQFALCYWYSLGGYLATGFDHVGRCQDVAGPSHLRSGAIYINMRDELSPIVFAGLPQRSYVWSNPWYTSHEPLTRQTVSFFREQRFQILQILRHPLDVIVSNAAKITTSAGSRAPQLLLQNDAWMHGMLDTMEAYYAGIAEHYDSNEIAWIRYEEVLADPLRMIGRLAEILGVKADDQLISGIWEKLDGKLLSDPGHLWNPRAGKWRDFIPPRFVERIRKSRLRDYAEAAGYNMEADDFTGGQAEVPANDADPLHIAWQDARWESSCGKPPSITHPDVYREHDREKGLLMVGGGRYAGTIQALGDSPLLDDLLQAARFEPWAEPGLIAEYLGLR